MADGFNLKNKLSWIACQSWPRGATFRVKQQCNRSYMLLCNRRRKRGQHFNISKNGQLLTFDDESLPFSTNLHKYRILDEKRSRRFQQSNLEKFLTSVPCRSPDTETDEGPTLAAPVASAATAWVNQAAAAMVAAGSPEGALREPGSWKSNSNL